jgi:hypothetical protein
MSAVLLTQQDGIGRHGLSVAIGLGLPVVLDPEASTLPERTQVSLGGEGAHPRWEVVPPPGATSVRPIAIHRAGDEIEIISGQAEELVFAAALIARGDTRGVGLVRLEHLLLQDPEATVEDLCWSIERILTACAAVPVAIRLPMWAHDKVAPPGLFLRDSRTYVDAIEAAAARVQHPAVTVVRRHSDPKPRVVGAGVFVETPLATVDPASPLWIGLGDLSAHCRSQEELQSFVSALCRRTKSGVHLCGIAGPWGQRGRSGTLEYKARSGSSSSP